MRLEVECHQYLESYLIISNYAVDKDIIKCPNQMQLKLTNASGGCMTGRLMSCETKYYYYYLLL